MGVTSNMPIWISIPFIVMLLAIAIGPLIAGKWWDRNRNKLLVSLLLSTPIIIFMITNGHSSNIISTIINDYFPFIVLLGSLFIITGGIHITCDLRATPLNNTIFLTIGYILASVMGTTGAAMLLIRPVITTNQEREYTTHTILFFIASIANCGGLLTSLGDPPLFMLYLRGVHFSWFLCNLFPEWILTGSILMTIYFFIDKYFYKKESIINIEKDIAQQQPIRIKGKINFIFLIGVILAVSLINKDIFPQLSNNDAPIWIRHLRENVLIILALLSLIFTKRKVRNNNNFSWAPIIEVACLFLGIFITMSPSLIWLSENAINLGVSTPKEFMYSSGILSSFLDNTPTALAFYDLAHGLPHGTIPNASFVTGIPAILLKAICIGSVFFGSITYIGNGPNFMIKSIAEENGIKMPGFFAYMYKFSLVILLPIYIIIQLIFI